MKTYKQLVEGINETLSLLEEVEGLHEDLGKHLAHAVKHLGIAQIGDVDHPEKHEKKFHDAVEKVRQSHGEQAAKDFHAHAHDEAHHLTGSGPGERGSQFHKHMSDSEKKSYTKHFNKLLGEEVEGLDEISQRLAVKAVAKRGEKVYTDAIQRGDEADPHQEKKFTSGLKRVKKKFGNDAAQKVNRKVGDKIGYYEEFDLDESRMKELAMDMESLSHADFKRKHRRTKQEMQSSLKSEALKGNQHKIDANKNGKVDGHDFKILRNQKKARYQ